MAAKDIGTIRDYIQTRLNTLADPLRAYDTFDEQMHAPEIMVIYPRPPANGSHSLGGPGPCAIRYNFSIEIWADTQAGVARAQDVIDAYLSPTGTNTSSVEDCLEDRTVDDNLTAYTTSIMVGAMDSYQIIDLQNGGRFAVATVPVEVFCDNS